MKNANPKVDGYFSSAKNWRKEAEALRAIALDYGLTEELKWRQPCYTFEGKNIAIIQGFKEYCAFMFFKGALLKDPKGMLAPPGENSQSARQARFTDVRDIAKSKAVLKAYIREAVDVEKSGLKVELKKITEREIPEELRKKFAKSAALKTAFNALTPGRRRAYLLFFSGAKQSATRESRIEKCAPRILAGKGLND